MVLQQDQQIQKSVRATVLPSFSQLGQFLPYSCPVRTRQHCHRKPSCQIMLTQEGLSTHYKTTMSTMSFYNSVKCKGTASKRGGGGQLQRWKEVLPKADVELESTFAVHIHMVSDQLLVCAISIHTSYLLDIALIIQVAAIQTGPGAHPASYSMGTGSFPGVKLPGRGVNHPPPSNTELKERVQPCLYSPSVPSWPVIGLTLHLLFTILILATPGVGPKKPAPMLICFETSLSFVDCRHHHHHRRRLL